MKNRNITHKNDWRTPSRLKIDLENEFWAMFDPCPFLHDTKQWDWLKIDWQDVNFINPPYSLDLKTAFVEKAIEESKKWKTCIMLLPVSTSTKLFHDHIIPNNKEIRLEPTNPAPPVTTNILFIILILLSMLYMYLIYHLLNLS